MTHRRCVSLRTLLTALLVGFASPAFPQEADDVVPGVPFEEGDVISFESISKLKDYLPPEFWENREYFFYEGMALEIGPFFRDYENNQAYEAASARFRGQARIGKDGALENFTAGRPFHTDDIDCKGDPHAGIKIIWNMMKAWNGSGAKAIWSYTYWDRGDRLPLYYEGAARAILMMERVEPQYEETGHAIFEGEKRRGINGVEVVAPFDARGIMLLTYRYKASDYSLDKAKNDDTWVYIPDLRRVRRISRAQRTDSVAGTDFTMDDLRSFSGIPPQYMWECLGEHQTLGPMNTKNLAYPYSEDYNYGPYGFSFADDRWELRNTWVIRFDPKSDDHPYHHKDIYIDKDTYEPLYSFAYDRKQELWKIIWHNHRYSEDWNGSAPDKMDPKAKDGVWYKSWEGIGEVRDLRLTTDIIVNVQTGTGNRIEFVDNQGTPLPTKGKIRRYIDIGRLSKGR
jgi:hypothetical protein